MMTKLGKLSYMTPKSLTFDDCLHQHLETDHYGDLNIIFFIGIVNL